jgi:peroxiredoxin
VAAGTKGFAVKRRMLIPVSMVLLAALAMLSACGGDSNADAAKPAADAAASHAAQTPPPPPPFGVGKPAPDFALKDIDGNTVRLSDHRGKAVIVDFWATWCGPCRAVMPTLEALSKDYDGKLEILAVSLDRDPVAAVPPFAAKNGLTFTMLADPAAMHVAQQWGGIRSIPTSFLIDAEGTVVKDWVGGHPRDEYEREIRKVLGMDS